jgi:hypothetical protein
MAPTTSVLTALSNQYIGPTRVQNVVEVPVCPLPLLRYGPMRNEADDHHNRPPFPTG